MNTLFLLCVLYLFPAISLAENITTVIAGDSYSGGEVGIALEKLFIQKGEMVARYGISSSRVFHWYEQDENDKVMGSGVGWPDWMAPGQRGKGHVREDYPKLRSILQGEAPKAAKLVIILGTNGICEKRTINDAAKLAAQVKQAMPQIQCYWVGPKLFEGVCNGDLKRQREFSLNLGKAVDSNCRFINSTKLKTRVGDEPHNGDFANEWATAVASQFN